MSDYREVHEQARAAGIVRRNETRHERAQTVIGELDQQIRVIPEGAYVRVVIADETGESFSTLRLNPNAADRLIRILTQARAVVEAPRDHS